MPILARAGAAAAKGFGMLGKIAAAVDEYFEYVTLLLHGNGTNGAQNNTFLDSSTNNFTITRNGNTTQGTFAPYGSNWSNYFNGSTDYLSIPNNTAIHVLGSDFCLEGWFFMAAAQGDYGLFSTYAFSSGNDSGYVVRLTSTGIRVVLGPGTGAATIIDRTYAFSTGQWYHFAFTNSSSTGRIFVNGVQQGATFSTSGFANSTANLWIGNVQTTSTFFPGYLSNFRVVKGSAVYTSGFTPSIAPLTAITNTSLLTCQSNRFIDNSSNAFTITTSGSPSVQRFSPFNPTTPYAAGTIGGSGYFDGSGDYLSLTGTALGSGDFTVECWFNMPSWSTSNYPVIGSASSGTTAGWELYLNGPGSNIRLWSNAGDVISSSATIQKNAWCHVALVRSGSTATLYINGVNTGSATFTSNLTNTTMYVSYDQYAQTMTGYVSNVRHVVGTAVYTSNFTPPTAPVTAITNTSLLLNFTNGGIIDNAMMNDLETVGNAQISTSVSKFGGGSLAFDGTGDYLKSLNGNVVQLTNNTPFTIECWVYFNATSGTPFILQAYNPASPYQGYGLRVNSTSGNFEFWDGSTWNSFGTAATTSAWTHIAVSYEGSGTTRRLFVNGTQGVSASTLPSAVNYTSGLVYIGSSDSGNNLNGYIDDLRITKGYARYTANFTPPTAPFPDQ